MKKWLYGSLAVLALATVGVYFRGSLLPHGDTSRMGPLINFEPAKPSVSRPVALRGKIDDALTRQVLEALAAGVREFTLDSSFGGSQWAAIIMANAIRQRGGSVTAIGTCYSACALLLIGVEHKFYTSEADIEVHGARYAYPQPGQDADAPARMTVSYLEANGVPFDLARAWGMAINLHRLGAKELAKAGIQFRAAMGG
jgi:hypothetical protein